MANNANNLRFGLLLDCTLVDGQLTYDEGVQRIEQWLDLLRRRFKLDSMVTVEYPATVILDTELLPKIKELIGEQPIWQTSNQNH